MKTIYQAISIVLVALFASCNSDETDAPATTGGTTLVRFHAAVDEDKTRANIDVDGDRFTGTWEEGDAMGVLYSVPGSSAFSEPKRFVYNNNAFSFEGELPAATGEWQYMAFYPHAAVSGNTASIPFGNLRSQKGSEFNCASDALVAEVLGFSNAKQGETDGGEPVKFRLNRLTSILNLSVQGGAGAGDAVRHILLTSENDEQPLSAQSIDFDISTLGADVVLNAGARSNVIALGFDSGTAPAADAFEAYFNIMPGNYDRLTFDVITEAKQIGTVTVTRDDPERKFAAGMLYRKEAADITFRPAGAPSFDWPGQDLDATHDITVDEESNLTYPAAITINAPAGIAGLRIEVTSEFLNEEIGITGMDIFNDETIQTAVGELPFFGLELACTTQVQYKKSTVFDITRLLPMILIGGAENSLHVFEVHVTDLAGQETVQALTFKVPEAPLLPEVVYNSDADLWTNTATLTVGNADPATAVLEYRAADEQTWQTASLTPNEDGTLTATIAPVWIQSQNGASEVVHQITPGTGIFAGQTYQYQLKVNGSVECSDSFTTAPGDTIYNAGMEHWSTYTVTGGFFTGGTVPFPNESGTEFWIGGNNNQTKSLCTGVTVDGSNGTCAQLKPDVKVNIFAAGNLFTGSFDCGTGFLDTFGFARFGVKYDFSARPRALQLRYNATISKVTNVGKSDLTTDDIDKSRIFVCVIDWTGRHAVKSGAAFDVNTFWDPEKQSSVSEGPILGYGSVTLEQSSNGWETLTLPINWYDQTAFPTAGNYSLVISCATSYKGDYVAGSTNNVLYVEDFEWVY